MNILVVGSGGREHALVHALAESRLVSKLYAAPGNAGTYERAEPVGIQADAVDPLARFADGNGIELTLVGPEVPLSLGIVDLFRSRDLPIIGPTAACARLESSKSFTKRLCVEQSIPTASYVESEDATAACRVLEQSRYPIVVKADGLAAGKGVVVAESYEEARKAVTNFMELGTLGSSGSRVVIEDFMEGEEVSFHVFADGETFHPMVVSQDHKRRFAGDRGPNTGGMGAYSIDTALESADREAVIGRMIRPTLTALGDYTGILYAGVMLTTDGPKLVEYNVRFGDPETQVILPRLETDLAEILVAMRDHRLGEIDVRWRPLVSATVVLVAEAYPGKVVQGKEIRGLKEAGRVSGVTVYHAGTRSEGGRVYTAGGRILNVTGVGESLAAALGKAYEAAEMIDFEGKDCRRDIGQKGLAKAG